MIEQRRIGLASDHAGYQLKSALVGWLRGQGHEVTDLGPADTASVDYPDYGYRLAMALAEGACDFGIAVCGSGIGISIAMNRHPRVRCALVSEALSARLARQHNDANAIALGARLIGEEVARDCVMAFLGTEFHGERHQRRVDKLGHPDFTVVSPAAVSQAPSCALFPSVEEHSR